MPSSSSRLFLAVAAVAAFAGCGDGASSDTTAIEHREEREVLWSAGHETGDMSEWLVDQDEAVFNTGTGVVRWTNELAHGGEGALALSVTGASSETQGARIFRWAENPAEATYGAWYLFPEPVDPDRWWNVFQFKSRVGDTTDPTWIVNVGADDAGRMYLYLYDAITETAYHQSDDDRMELPVGRWTHIMAYLDRGEEGGIALWQDGELLFDIEGVQTSLADNVQWSINNYSDDLDPPDVTIYADDAEIIAGRPEELG